MEIHQLPILNDNYCHVLVCGESRKLAVVDPADPERSFPFFRNLKWNWNGSSVHTTTGIMPGGTRKS